MGYQVTAVVQTGEDVIENTATTRPDIILMDITLGGKINGIHAVQKIHSRADIPVIYLTAHSDKDTFELAKQTEPYAYLIKPYEFFQLQNAIEIALFRQDLKKQLQESKDRYRTLFEVSDNAMMLVDEGSTIIEVNQQFETMTGCSKTSVEHVKSWTDFFNSSERAKLEEHLNNLDTLETEPQNHFELLLGDTQDNPRFVYTNVRKIPGTHTCIISMSDISELKTAEKQIKLLNSELSTINTGLKQEIKLREGVEKLLRHKATHDHLTGLPNRILLFDRMKQAFAFEARHNTLIALMILDLDNFKTINDTLGHLSGDILLKKVALGLQKCMRQYDTVGRLGGDEFVIIINDADTVQDIITFAEKVLAIFQSPFDILGQQTYVTTSIGVAVYPHHGSTIESLLKKADMAMYVAKKEGRNTFRFFTDSMDIRISGQQTDMRTKRRIAQMERSSLNNLLSPDNSMPKKGQLVH